MTLIFFTTFAAVFIAEIVGDKLLYTTSVLAARYRTAPIMIGMAVAFMAKMGAAVLVGEAISRLPRILVATITAISFQRRRRFVAQTRSQGRVEARAHS